mgnify:CR=1 FL=1
MVKFIYDASEETRIREIAHLREKALHDEASALKNAKAEGRAEGRAEGEASIIAKMKVFGMTEEQIRRIISDT